MYIVQFNFILIIKYVQFIRLSAQGEHLYRLNLFTS